MRAPRSPIDFESEPGANRSKKLPSLAERMTVHELNGTMRPTTRRPAPAPRGFVQEPNERRSERGELGATRTTLPAPRATLRIGFRLRRRERATCGSEASPEATVALPTEGQAFRFWLKLGMISFGGPAGQIAIMHDEIVEKRRWISERRFLHALNFCMALPGPEAQQLASYIGYSMYGVRGALTAGGLFVLPSFFLLCLMSAIYVEYGEVAAVAGVVRGLGAAVIALVAAAVLRVGGRVIHTPTALALAAVAFGLLIVGVPFPLIIAVAALVGYAVGRGGRRFSGSRRVTERTIPTRCAPRADFGDGS